jgi:hypothetical protein
LKENLKMHPIAVKFVSLQLGGGGGSRIMLNLPVSVREALKEHRIPFTGDETWLKLSFMYLTERVHHLHAQTRPVCSNVKSVLTLSFDIHRFVLYIFVPQGQTETTITTLTC